LDAEFWEQERYQGWRTPRIGVMMRAVVVQEYGKAPVASEIAEPDGESGEVLAAALNPADVVVSKGLLPVRRPEPPLVLGTDGVARRRDGTLVAFWQPPVPYGAFAERVPLTGVATVPLPKGLDPGLAAAVVNTSGLAAWTGLAVSGALQPGESVLVLGANGQVGRVAVQAARLLGARRVAGVVHDEAGAEVPLRLGADVVESSLDTGTLADRLLAEDTQGYDVILDTLWGPVIGAALGAAAKGARVVQIGNSAGAAATITATAIRNKGVSILPHVNPAIPERARSEAFTRLAEHAAAGELTVEYSETRMDALPDVWEDFTAGKVTAKLIVKPLEGR
jgi:NADPH2:quinone reductase